MRHPLLQTLLGGLVEHFIEDETVNFIFGSTGTLVSDITGRAFAWIFFMAAINIFYQTVPSLVQTYCKYKYPLAPTSNVSHKLIDEMMQKSYRAFPLYVCVPLCTDFFVVKGWSSSCETVKDCGGLVHAFVGCVVYFFAVEFLVYGVHYSLLHKSHIGKRIMQHTQHHVYKYPDQLNAFSGYAFAAQDGFSQGAALAACTLFIRVPISFVHAMEIITAFWTLYIHTDISPIPWPFMGCDYHLIHHRYNWYNFGFMTLLCDELFHTVKHPKQDASEYAIGKKQITERERHKSKVLTDLILRRVPVSVDNF